MIKFKKKLMLTFFAVVLVSTAIMGTALAGVSVSGPSQVYPGGTYMYKITVTKTGSSIMGTATSGGVLGSHSTTWGKDSSTGLNKSLTATCSITVTVPSSATIGSTGTITVSGEGSSYDGTNPITKFSISGSKSVTVVAPPTPPPPTAWELAIKDIKRVDDGGSITVEMNAEKSKEINVPVEVFQTIKDKGVALTIDYGSFLCMIDGKAVGEVPAGGEDINVGYTLMSADRDRDMLVFTLNNRSQLFYIASYAMTPFLDLPDGMIYVYREYENINILEYVNSALTDDEDNVVVRIFAPGKYIVSAASIAGTEGNMDSEALIAMFATPTPEPTPEPTPALAPTPAPTAEPEKKGIVSSGLILGLAALLVVLIGAMAVVIVIRKKNVTEEYQRDSE